MDNLVIRPCTYDDIAHGPQSGELLREYAEESAIEELKPYNPNDDIYRGMERMGLVHCIGAFKGEVMIGFLIFIVSVIPHFSRKSATAESYFVTAGERKTGAGIRLYELLRRWPESLELNASCCRPQSAAAWSACFTVQSTARRMWRSLGAWNDPCRRIISHHCNDTCGHR